VYLLCGEMATFETAFYLSAQNDTALGYGDVVLSQRWRLLGPLEAINGLLLFGLSTAVMFAVLSRLITNRLRHQHGHRSEGQESLSASLRAASAFRLSFRFVCPSSPADQLSRNATFFSMGSRLTCRRLAGKSGSAWPIASPHRIVNSAGIASCARTVSGDPATETSTQGPTPRAVQANSNVCTDIPTLRASAR